MTKVERWRKERGYTYRQLAELLGCSHQYCRNLCLHGTAASIKLIKLIKIAQGEIGLEDFLSAEDRRELEEQGFIQKQTEDFLV